MSQEFLAFIVSIKLGMGQEEQVQLEVDQDARTSPCLNQWIDFLVAGRLNPLLR